MTEEEIHKIVGLKKLIEDKMNAHESNATHIAKYAMRSSTPETLELEKLRFKVEDDVRQAYYSCLVWIETAFNNIK